MQTKLQWLQDPIVVNEDNLNNVRREASRHFRNKKREYKELLHQWKQSIFVPIHKKCDKNECSNYRGISLLPTSYKILSNILLSRLIPYAD
jgi:hypothetical protein